MGRSGHHLTHDSLGPSESTTQTECRSVQPFLHRRPQSVPKLYNGTPLSRSKLPLPMGDLDSHLMCGSLAHPSPQPKRHLDRFSCFCRAHYCDRPTDRPHYSVGNNRPHLSTYIVLGCGLIINSDQLRNHRQ